MNLFDHRLLALLISIITFAVAGCSLLKGEIPINALLITGGCCHDYNFQKRELTTGISKFAEVDWTIVHEGGDARDFQSKLFESPNWAAEYDVVVHNQCLANTKMPNIFRRLFQVTNKEYQPLSYIVLCIPTERRRKTSGGSS